LRFPPTPPANSYPPWQKRAQKEKPDFLTRMAEVYKNHTLTVFLRQMFRILVDSAIKFVKKYFGTLQSQVKRIAACGENGFAVESKAEGIIRRRTITRFAFVFNRSR
jgi:hypothetical protein